MDSRDLQGLMEAYAEVCGSVSVEEGRALGQAGRDDDNNPRGAAVRASSGRGMTMTPARGLGASKPKGDDKKRAAKQAAQAKEDRRAAAKDRAAEGEDRLSKLVRSVQNSSYEPEGEQIDEISANLALTASQKADEMRRKAAVAGDKETASKKAAQASRLYAGVGPRRAKERQRVDELYKGKHGQSETEYQDSRSNAGKMVSGTSKLSGAAYSYRGVKNTGPNPAGGSEKPKAQGRMTSGQRTELQYRKANLMKKEEVDIFDAVLEYLVAEGYAATNKEALVIMANMSEEWKQEIVEYRKLAAGLVGGMMALNMMKPGIPSPQHRTPTPERERTELPSSQRSPGSAESLKKRLEDLKKKNDADAAKLDQTIQRDKAQRDASYRR